ncbi:MAG TPA: nucleotidyl transferase AbiEii/AbiGii toxin family protein [Bacteroidales bacterium]|jgi:predicted nucleotidyltransferase component of viral defense system|nr:nucleotidyl transferase AbiEii/AbiGii toxin family protein [Bacteroidales bacterium]
MNTTLFSQMMSRYSITTREDQINATHEVMQQIVLAGLYRGGFFNKAAFYGGTCLRIFYGLDRFSEDMDFSLLEADNSFQLENYFDSIMDEFSLHGRKVAITKKEKRSETNIESAFLKDNTEIYDVSFTTEKQIKIKIEIDKNPPLGFETDYKLLLLPFSFMVNCYTLPNLFAGKIHAFLFRKWNNRVKGRDWYDFEWYCRNQIPLNFKHLQNRTQQINKITTDDFSIEIFKSMMKERIESTDINLVKNDVKPFIKNQQPLDIWSQEYFIKLIDLIKIS